MIPLDTSPAVWLLFTALDVPSMTSHASCPGLGGEAFLTLKVSFGCLYEHVASLAPTILARL